jgi:hypothetical protein
MTEREKAMLSTAGLFMCVLLVGMIVWQAPMWATGFIAAAADTVVGAAVIALAVAIKTRRDRKASR